MGQGRAEVALAGTLWAHAGQTTAGSRCSQLQKKQMLFSVFFLQVFLCPPFFFLKAGAGQTALLTGLEVHNAAELLPLCERRVGLHQPLHACTHARRGDQS